MTPYVEVYALLSRHYDMQHLGRMPLRFGVRAVWEAMKRREEARAWDMWVSRYPWMDKKTFVPFSRFFREQQQPPPVHRPAEELLAEAERIREAVGRKSLP